jgi:hypothetical protein
MSAETCGLGEGTHYGCECVMRRLAEAEAGWKRCAADLVSETARANRTEERAEAAEARATRAEGALREAFPVGSWCAYCGQEIDKPESHPCPKCSSARRALAGEAQKEGTP